jgi:hypothetical protein
MVEVEGREHDDAGCLAGAGQDLSGGCKTVHVGHPDVHQYHVGPVPLDRVDGLDPGRRLGDHLDPVGGQDHPEPGPDQRLVVGDHHTQCCGHAASTGIRACTR